MLRLLLQVPREEALIFYATMLFPRLVLSEFLSCPNFDSVHTIQLLSDK